jgi:hypothetical protein
MNQNRTLTASRLRTPKAAAIAGILFSVLTTIVFWLLWTTVPGDPQEPGAWLKSSSDKVALGLNLIPFAGVASLWFIGVLRDRLGKDRFFANVFFGSGLLFLGMRFVAAAIAGAIPVVFVEEPEQVINSPIFHFARAAAYNILTIYMIRMAGVFMITTSTIATRVKFARWCLVFLATCSR